MDSLQGACQSCFPSPVLDEIPVQMTGGWLRRRKVIWSKNQIIEMGQERDESVLQVGTAQNKRLTLMGLRRPSGLT